MKTRHLFSLAVLLVATAYGAPGWAEEPPRASIPAELAVSAGTSIVLAPAVYSSARQIGNSTSNLVTSAFPALIFAAAVPPAIAAGILSWERKREGAKTGFLAPYLYSLGAQLVVLGASFFTNTFIGDPKDLLVMSAITGLATGGAATLGAEIHFR
ncbi:MAG: hypothetical protein U0270_27665 [Labilithrix sp.]